MTNFKTIKKIGAIEIVEATYDDGRKAMTVMEGAYTHYHLMIMDGMSKDYPFFKCLDEAKKILAVGV